MFILLLMPVLATVAGTGLQSGEHLMTLGRRRPEGGGARRARASLGWPSRPSALGILGRPACVAGHARLSPAAAGAGPGPDTALC